MQNNNDDYGDIDAVVKQINKSLSLAQGSLNGITLQGGSVTLETIATQSGGGGFKIFVKASRKWQKEASSSVTYNFSKPGVSALEISADQPDQLAEIIKQTTEQFKKTMTIDGLVKESFEVEISLSIKKVTELGVEFELFDVGFDVGGDMEKRVFHKITLKFKLIN